MSSSPIRPSHSSDEDHVPTPPTPPPTSPSRAPNGESIEFQSRCQPTLHLCMSRTNDNVVARALQQLRDGDPGFIRTTLPPAHLMSSSKARKQSQVPRAQKIGEDAGPRLSSLPSAPPVAAKESRRVRSLEESPWNPDQDRLVGEKSPDETPLSSLPTSLASPPDSKRYDCQYLSYPSLARTRASVTSDPKQALQAIEIAPFRKGIWPTAADMTDIDKKRAFINADTSRFSGGQIFELLRAQGRIAGKDGSAVSQHHDVVDLAKSIAKESAIMPSKQPGARKRKGVVHLVPEPAGEPKRKVARTEEKDGEGSRNTVSDVLWAVGQCYGE